MSTYSGMNVPIDKLPREALSLIDRWINVDAFKVRLKEGGSITLDNSNLIIGQPNFNENTFSFIACDKLELKNGAKIITNGNTLVIFVNDLISENGEIQSFIVKDKKAPNGKDATEEGQAGDRGYPGDSGGLVSMHIIGQLTGFLNVDLAGQSGGDGGKGKKGRKGTAGTRGQRAVDGAGWCEKGGGNGSRGGLGFPGGDGGDAGDGGHGGIFEVYTVGAEPISSSSYKFSGSGGVPGTPGSGAEGGDGGDGGAGGHGSKFCKGGHHGPDGKKGEHGENGQPGKVPANGSAICKNIEIETMLRDIPALRA